LRNSGLLALFLQCHQYKSKNESDMKRLILTLACASIFGATATFAQDTTRTKTQTPQQQQQTDQLRTDDKAGWTAVKANDIPSNLRTTLNDTKYKGWDTEGSVYKNQSGEYVLRMGAGTGQTSHYFDRNGKAVTKPNEKPRDN
jgi:hypothetical protein